MTSVWFVATSTMEDMNSLQSSSNQRVALRRMLSKGIFLSLTTRLKSIWIEVGKKTNAKIRLNWCNQNYHLRLRWWKDSLAPFLSRGKNYLIFLNLKEIVKILKRRDQNLMRFENRKVVKDRDQSATPKQTKIGSEKSWFILLWIKQ